MKEIVGEKLRNSTSSKGGKEQPTYNKKKECKLDWSQLVLELPSKKHY